MLTHKHILILSALSLAVTSALAGVSAEEAKKLGTTLTPVGAEVAGNADKSIPAYTGGLTKAPAGYEKGSGIRPDPFASEKPLYSITSANMAQHESKLTAGTRELLKRYPTMRVDVYPTHRSAGYPKSVLDNSIKNATSVKTTDGGLGVEGTYAGIPFPIPKTGHEAMWNHLLRYMGHSYITKYDSINVNSSGNAVLAKLARWRSNIPTTHRIVRANLRPRTSISASRSPIPHRHAVPAKRCWFRTTSTCSSSRARLGSIFPVNVA